MYEGMILINPNLILNVKVPITVLKQVEQWQRGTRSRQTVYVQYKPEDKSGQANLDSDEDDSEDNLDQSSGSGHETDDQSKATDKTKLQNEPRKESVRQSDQKTNVSGTDYHANPIQRHYQREPDASEDPAESSFAGNNARNRFASFERDPPSSAHALCQDAGIPRSVQKIQAGDVASGCTAIDSAALGVESESVQPRRHTIRPYEQVRNARATPTLSLSVPNRDSVRPTKPPLQGLEDGAGCSSAKEAVQPLQQTTPPTTVMRRPGQTGPARSGRRVHYR